MYNEGLRQLPSIFYAESWAITHYVTLTRPNGPAAINAYITAIAKGAAPTDAFTEAFGTTPADFDKEIQLYLRRMTFPGIRFTFNDKLQVAAPTTARTMTAGEVEAWTGDLERRSRRLEEGDMPRIEHAATSSNPMCWPRRS